MMSMAGCRVCKSEKIVKLGMPGFHSLILPQLMSLPYLKLAEVCFENLLKKRQRIVPDSGHAG